MPHGPIVHPHGPLVAGGRQVARVEASSDGGRHWARAALEQGSGP